MPFHLFWQHSSQLLICMFFAENSEPCYRLRCIIAAIQVIRKLLQCFVAVGGHRWPAVQFLFHRTSYIEFITVQALV